VIARALAAIALLAGTAAADRVERATSRWHGDMIVTDVLIRRDDGTLATITEHGGSVGGIGMWVSHRDAGLRPGDAVELLADRVRRSAKPANATGASGAAVQRTSRSGRALYHPSGCLSFEYAGESQRIAGGLAAFDAAFRAWGVASSDSACGGVRFDLQRVPNAPDGRDGINTIRFRDDRWCRPASGDEAELCHDPNAVAVTRVLYIDEPISPRDGEIIEVDIEVNAVGFTFASDGRSGAIDLPSAAAHEIGHALGLDHNCGVEGSVWPLDRDGNPVPSCESASPDLVDATMYIQVGPGTVHMRSPQPSDVDGLCTSIGAVCEGDVTGGCSAGGGSASLIVLLTALAGASRRSRRARA
jgi:hypothetical protein